ncbi:CDP-diacylglycerol--glycerol-3-phosphate 3-phosphatidyltransferase [Candidatus Jidaibacter acanthamoebae]|nr:CDP-diacylglycerol--glycerol-3-phosphate 3-phosphatidyltransferase [Candidatus Jidaibacter acanthamoeba]MBA8666695.1 CDP-diacylglycerol--glycerol-3-phosphate 3-phosphatidyltransferase [Holosporaceae bacterium 'Namur']
MLKELPNFLTVLRILLIPVLVLSFYLEGKLSHYIAASIFIFASITDFFDGYLARVLKAQSNFGKMLDPIADKLLVASTLMMLVHFGHAPVIPTIAILCREILVSGLREYLAEFKVSIPVSKLGKVKTAVQMAAIIILLLGNKVLPIPYLDRIGEIALWVAAVLTLITGYAYWKERFKYI